MVSYFSEIFRNHGAQKELFRNVKASHFPRHFHFLSLFSLYHNREQKVSAYCWSSVCAKREIRASLGPRPLLSFWELLAATPSAWNLVALLCFY